MCLSSRKSCLGALRLGGEAQLRVAMAHNYRPPLCPAPLHDRTAVLAALFSSLRGRAGRGGGGGWPP